MQDSRTGLAKGWRPVTDPQSGETYYWNPNTDEVTWKRPTPPRDLIGDASLARGFGWLDEWMAREQLELDVPWPQGIEPSAGVGALVEHAWRCSTDADKWPVTHRDGGVACKTVRVGGLPTGSTEWAVDVPGVTLQTFVEFKLEAANPGAWDLGFLGAELLDAIGTPDRIGQPFAQLVRWRTRSWPCDRETLYLVVPSLRDDRSAVRACCASFPPSLLTRPAPAVALAPNAPTLRPLTLARSLPAPAGARRRCSHTFRCARRTTRRSRATRAAAASRPRLTWPPACPAAACGCVASRPRSWAAACRAASTRSCSRVGSLARPPRPCACARRSRPRPAARRG